LPIVGNGFSSGDGWMRLEPNMLIKRVMYLTLFRRGTEINPGAAVACGLLEVKLAI
jgi:hypothetical protein